MTNRQRLTKHFKVGKDGFIHSELFESGKSRMPFNVKELEFLMNLAFHLGYDQSTSDWKKKAEPVLKRFGI